MLSFYARLKKCNNPKIIICDLLPGDEFWSVNSIIIIIKKVNDSLNYKCSCNFFYLCKSVMVRYMRMEALINRYSRRTPSNYQRKETSSLPIAAINPVYCNTVINSKYTGAVCFWFKKGDFSPSKQLSSDALKAIFSLQVAIQKSANSFVARKSASIVSRNLIRPTLASKPVCKVSSKLVKCKVACESDLYVSIKSLKSKVACEPVSNVLCKPVKSIIACKPVTFSVISFLLILQCLLFLLNLLSTHLSNL